MIIISELLLQKNPQILTVHDSNVQLVVTDHRMGRLLIFHQTTVPQKNYNTVVQQKDYCQRTQYDELNITVLPASYDKSQEEKSTFWLKTAPQKYYSNHSLVLENMCGSWSLNNCSTKVLQYYVQPGTTERSLSKKHKIINCTLQYWQPVMTCHRSKRVLFFIKQLLYRSITVKHNLVLETICGSWSLNNCSITAQTVHCSSVLLVMTDQGGKDLLFHWTSGP